MSTEVKVLSAERPTTSGRGTSARDRASGGEPRPVSDAARIAAGLSSFVLWLRYFELGGMHTFKEVESFLQSDGMMSLHDQGILAQALDEGHSAAGSTHDGALNADPSARSWNRIPSRAASSGRLRLLGSFDLSVDAEAVDVAMNAQRLVAFLAIRGGPLLREHVAGSLWGDTTERRASGSLRSALWRLGGAAFPLVTITHTHIQISPHVAVDLRESAAFAQRILEGSYPMIGAEVDVSLLTDELLPDWTEDWVLSARASHNQLRSRALDALSARLETLGRPGEAVQVALLAVDVEPLRESAHRTLVRAHLADGNVPAAVAQFDSFRKLMHDELGIEPSSDMQMLVVGLGGRTAMGE